MVIPMKNSFKALFVAVLLVGGISNQANAQTSSLDGKACKKAGLTQKKAGSTFKCTKVGKKLVWKIASTNANAGGFGNGTHIVGTAVKPGRYVTTTASSFCYWERMSGFGGSLDEINANEIGNGAHMVVDILATDRGFKSNGCGTWVPYTPKPAAKITDGTWVINDEMTPGLWQASKPADCYWERTSDFSGGLDSIIANEISGGIVQIEPTDVGFSSSRCGTWTKVG